MKKCIPSFFAILTSSLLLVVQTHPTGKRNVDVKFKVNASAVSQQYTIQPEKCNQATLLVIAVISQPAGFNIRRAIRDTWGSLAAKKYDVRFFFVLGRIGDKLLQTKLEAEAKTFRDILQSNQFVDAYRASTMKTLSLFQWCAGFCAGSKFVLRVDDDVWLNLPDFMEFIRDNLERPRALGYKIRKGAAVNRDPNHKYYVPREEFVSDTYPAYLSGALLTVPTKYLPLLIHESLRHTRVFLDDIFVAGILMPAINLKFAYMPRYANVEDVADRECPQKVFTAIHHAKRIDLRRFWTDPCYSSTKLKQAGWRFCSCNV